MEDKLLFAGMDRRPMRTNCGGHRHPSARPGNDTAVVNYCLELLEKKYVIASQSSDWRGNPPRFPVCLGDRHTSVRAGSR